MAAFINISGLRFGRLVVQELAQAKGEKKRWRCLCDCGKESISHATSLRAGKTLSCGCWKAEATRAKLFKHGESAASNDGKATPEYHAWKHIKDRAYNAKNKSYANYGGRGIKMYLPWQESFETFLEYVGRRPQGKTSIGRVDVNGSYEPGNVRWEDDAEQARSKRNSVFVDYQGKSCILQDAAKMAGVSASLLRIYMQLFGITFDDVILAMNKRIKVSLWLTEHLPDADNEAVLLSLIDQKILTQIFPSRLKRPFGDAKKKGTIVLDKQSHGYILTEAGRERLAISGSVAVSPVGAPVGSVTVALPASLSIPLKT